MNKNVQITDTLTGMSKSLDVIASNVIAGEYNSEQLHEKLGSVANVLATTASAHRHILGQVKDVNTFSTLASTDTFDETLSVVLGTQAQAQLIGQMIRGELGITAEEEEECDKDLESDKDLDEVQEAVSFEAPTEDVDKDGKADKDEAHGELDGSENVADLDHSLNSDSEENVEQKVPKKPIDAKSSLEATAQDLFAQGFVTEASELMSLAKKIGTGANHGEINPEVKQVEKKGANDVLKPDGTVPTVKTTASADATASVTAMSSEASTSQPLVQWNFN